FEGGEPESLEECGVEQTLSARVQRGEHGLVDEARDDHAISRDTLGLERVSQMRRKLSEVSHDHQAQIRVADRRSGERAKEAAHVLARIELSDVEDVAIGYREARANERAPFVFRRRIEIAVNGL